MRHPPSLAEALRVAPDAGSGLVASFGDVGAETAAALGAAGASAPPVLTPLATAAVLRVTGPDARDFLHGQLAADVRGLAPGAVTLSLLLNHKGHALADVTVIRRASDLLLIVADDRLEQVEGSLASHIVFDDVALTRVRGALLTLQGGGWRRVFTGLGQPAPGAGAQANFAAGDADGVEVIAYESRRSLAGGVDLLAVATDPAAAAEVGAAALTLAEALGAAGAVPVGEVALAAARVAALVPAAALDGGDGVLPQEAGMEDRLSYRKGCYLGQEIMARIEARGNLKRSLGRLVFATRPPGSEPEWLSHAGSPVVLGGKVVGRLGTLAPCSNDPASGLAVLRRDVPEDAALEVLGALAKIAR